MNQPIPLSAVNSSAEVFLGRQPILDGKKQIIAYELLFRSKNSLDDAEVEDDLQATSTVIVNTLSQFGLDQVLGKKVGFLNVSASFLLSETVNLLPPERIVLEILEDVPISPLIVARCEQLKEMGFKLALDDFEYRSEYDALFPMIDYVKIDLTLTPAAKLPELVKFLRKSTNAKLIAEKVEEIALFEQCQLLGFDAFQGFFFAKPTLLKSKKPQPHQTVLMRIMGELLGDVNLGNLEKLFKDNPSLTLSLLKLVNSVGIGGGRQSIESIRQAIVVLGQKQLLRWVQLLLYTSPDGKLGGTLMMQVANRARLMELIAKHIDAYQANFSEQAFMVGMLSLADVVMQITPEEVFQQIKLSEEIEQAVLKHEGILGQLLVLALKIENADFKAAERDIEALGISANDLLAIQLETMQWANQMTV
jgi:EAL and modified HD-GYP domain-containing signal transduction protein